MDNVCGSGGANVPALNRLLQPLGIAFRSAALHGPVSLGARPFDYLSGTALAALPAGALAHFASLSRVSSLRRPSPQAKSDASRVAVLGLHQPKGAAANEVRARLAQAGWVLLNVVSVFDDGGLAGRKANAGPYYLRF